MTTTRKILMVAALAFAQIPVMASAQTAPQVVAAELNTDHTLLGIKITAVQQVLAFDLSIPQVQYVIRLYEQRALGTNLGTYLPFFLQADPHALIRCTAEGQATANGEIIPGFTVGVANCSFNPPL
jgi:hypothetical protein